MLERGCLVPVIGPGPGEGGYRLGAQLACRIVLWLERVHESDGHGRSVIVPRAITATTDDRVVARETTRYCC
jgi:hypothetical protein